MTQGEEPDVSRGPQGPPGPPGPEGKQGKVGSRPWLDWTLERRSYYMIMAIGVVSVAILSFAGIAVNRAQEERVRDNRRVICFTAVNDHNHRVHNQSDHNKLLRWHGMDGVKLDPFGIPAECQEFPEILRLIEVP